MKLNLRTVAIAISVIFIMSVASAAVTNPTISDTLGFQFGNNTIGQDNATFGSVGIGTTEHSESLHVVGRVKVGTSVGSALDEPDLYVGSTKKITDNQYYEGVMSCPKIEKISAPYSGVFIAVYGEARIDANNTQNFIDSTYGSMGGYFSNSIAPGATGTLTSSNGVEINSDIRGMTVTNRAGLRIFRPNIVAPGTIQNNYGIYIEDQNVGTSTNYSIYSAGGQNYFGGNVGIGTTAPEGKVHTATSGTSNVMYLDTYMNSPDALSYIRMRHSNTNTIGTKTTTVDDSYLGGVQFFGVDSTNNFDGGAGIVAQQNGTAGTYVPTDIEIYTYSATTRNTGQLFLTSSGRVGIGTITPNATLDVNGSIYPAVNNSYSLGSATYQWSDIYANTSHIGDLGFANNWTLTEDGDALVFKNPSGEIVMALENNTIYGDIKPLSEWRK